MYKGSKIRGESMGYRLARTGEARFRDGTLQEAQLNEPAGISTEIAHATS
jgi:hypothetical protein